MDVGRLQLAVELLPVGWQQREVTLGRRRQRLDDPFERVTVEPVVQVEYLDRDLGIGLEQRPQPALRQVVAD